MRALVACLVCLVGCASSTYLEPLGEPAPDAAAETLADVVPALDAPAADVARVEPAREASVQVEAAAPDAGAPEVAADATALDAAPDAPKAIEAAADVAVDAALEVAVDVKPSLAVAGEWCGPERACAAEGLPWSANGTACLTDIAPVAYNIGDAPILTYCAKRCLVENSECIGWGGGCCATVRFADGTEGNACVSPENCK
jgi:hypothetical protein